MSLVKGLYKLLVKVLANKLRNGHEFLSFKFLACLHGGRQVLDAILMANEAINSIKKKVRI